MEVAVFVTVTAVGRFFLLTFVRVTFLLLGCFADSLDILTILVNTVAGSRKLVLEMTREMMCLQFTAVRVAVGELGRVVGGGSDGGLNVIFVVASDTVAMMESEVVFLKSSDMERAYRSEPCK